ncbi:TIGR02680 family protein [Heliobacterium gestii]|uniref:TIGR02680 family protein n=1 Tax=Heliomicrobium gestii TaxID=2699 RepID=A0A845LCW1_HELGE|nr:TIGR02680 family protein [Heliomicrobium gestii]MBM7866887.1 uncharacterized protein (TIGR02680 family) [Heliomicrobium gestii]MZP42315.1 TIGR02680 family protein [Heliomicrobium gestii]
MTSPRWRMHRAGILNFWFYDDEAEFELASGRAIFRGANGSGKSVTMQSFLPLVLDGDKRPHRLDPFGSKDRRMEYYLLVDDESITDRTGYLWLEFFHPLQERYLTIGIGLRARRNNPQVAFWGFVVTDNRRMGKDLSLYQLDYSDPKQPRKIPLTRQALAERIGAGGEVVSEQGKYKALVNRHLFGFNDLDAYSELLDLLIQLRSPKLSKDFKPTTIYEILGNALPPLHEEDLRPLAEVLDDMDQIGERLDELSRHQEDTNRLNQSYRRYNEHLLFSLSKELVERQGLRDTAEKDLRQSEQELKELDAKLASEKERQEKAQQALADYKAEREMLSQNEAFATQGQLDAKTRDRQFLAERKKTAENRLDETCQRLQKAMDRKDEAAETMGKAAAEQQSTLGDMAVLAGETDFPLHSFHSQPWEGAIPEEDGGFETWQKDWQGHRHRLEEAEKQARAVATLHQRKNDAENALSDAQKAKDRAEEEWRLAEDALEDAKEAQQAALFSWRASLRHLPLSEERFRESLHHLAGFPEKDYEKVRQPILADWQERNRQIAHDRAGRLRQKEELEQQRRELTAEREQWLAHKEPEPARLPARQAYRQHRQESNPAGAPFYACVEFLPSVDEPTRACLESALAEAGLLDAWVGPQGVAWAETAKAGDGAVPLDETWLQADPELLGITLTDYLCPLPPEESGLGDGAILDLLQTVRIADRDQVLQGSGDSPDPRGVWLSADGAYRLGARVGVAAAKPLAEFIGKESRRRTRLARIAALDGAIAEMDASITAIAGELERLSAEAAGLDGELALFPKGEGLQAANGAVITRRFQFDAADGECARQDERFRQAIKAYQDATAALHDCMKDLTIKRDEPSLRIALDKFDRYGRLWFQLKAAWEQHRAAKKHFADAAADEAAYNDQADREEAEIGDYEQELRRLDTEIESLQRRLRDMGLDDIMRRLDELRRLIAETEQAISAYHKNLPRLAESRGKTLTAYEQRHAALAAAQRELQRLQSQWLLEWKRGLLPDVADLCRSNSSKKVWRDPAHLAASVGPAAHAGDASFSPPSDLAGSVDQTVLETVLDTAQLLLQLWRGRYESRLAQSITNDLFSILNTIRQTLFQYVPESQEDEATGRVLIYFMRDRQNPITPQHLLDELTLAKEEQMLLLNQKDRELYEEIIIRAVGKTIRNRIHRAEQWVHRVNDLMGQRNTSSGLRLQLKWEPRPASSERELDTTALVKLLKTNPDQLHDDDIDRMVQHFRSRIEWAKQESEEKDSLRHWVNQLLDYRKWFRFVLYYEKGEGTRRELTDSRFNVLSGGEKAMSMYIPLFAATYSRYNDVRPEAPHIISLDEAFAGVDDENVRDMFDLLTQMDFDYMMTSQVLWGCYDTVPDLSIYEIFRPKDVNYVTLFHYHWNGHQKRYLESGSVEPWDGAAAKSSDEPADLPLPEGA